MQDPQTFAAETAQIEAASVPVSWPRPSDSDPDRAPVIEVMPSEEDAPEVETPAGGGRVRGLLLHKLMEEVLTGELREQADAFRAHARKLLAQLGLKKNGRFTRCRRNWRDRLANPAASGDRRTTPPGSSPSFPSTRG